MTELRPCPFCGCRQHTDDEGGETVRYTNQLRICDHCGCTTHNWNTRPIEDALIAEVERLREVYKHQTAIWTEKIYKLLNEIKGVEGQIETQYQITNRAIEMLRLQAVEIKKLRDALAKYADPDNWAGGISDGGLWVWMPSWDGSEIARGALEDNE